MDEATFEPYKKYVPVLLRVVIGLVFIGHGWGKITGIAGTAEFFAGQGIPASGLFAWIVATVEFVGGLSVLLGFLTRIWSALIAVVMVVAILVVQLPEGFVGGWEWEFSLLIVAISLVIAGSGPLSVDAARGQTASVESARV